MRIIVLIAAFYLIYSFYKSLQKPTKKKLIKKPITITATTTCPSPKIFIDYTEGRIKGKRKKAIDNHITHCKNCQDALRDVFDMSKEEALPEKCTRAK